MASFDDFRNNNNVFMRNKERKKGKKKKHRQATCQKYQPREKIQIFKQLVGHFADFRRINCIFE